MKRALIVVFVAAVAVLTWIVFQFMSITPNRTSKVTPEKPTPTTSNEPYTYSLIKAATSSSISLIPNFSEKRDAKSLADGNGCRSAINAGFYDTAGKPLGLFFTDNRTYGKQIQSALLNGYVWADETDGAFISTTLPDAPYRFALQTGPMLLFNGQPMKLAIRSDEPARRMVVAKTEENTLLFLTIYSRDSVFSGPFLSDLPAVVELISNKEKLGLSDALNLDGGSASAFYNGTVSLSELTPVGSLFCVK